MWRPGRDTTWASTKSVWKTNKHVLSIYPFLFHEQRLYMKKHTAGSNPKQSLHNEIWAVRENEWKVIPCTKNVNKHNSMKAYGGVEDIVPPFLTSALHGGEWSGSHLCHFTPWDSPHYPFDKRLGEPQGWSGCYREHKNLLSQPGIKPQSSGL
jgi:hypothetical protein